MVPRRQVGPLSIFASWVDTWRLSLTTLRTPCQRLARESGDPEIARLFGLKDVDGPRVTTVSALDNHREEGPYVGYSRLTSRFVEGLTTIRPVATACFGRATGHSSIGPQPGLWRMADRPIGSMSGWEYGLMLELSEVELARWEPKSRPCWQLATETL